MKKRLIIIANRLPVTVEHTNTGDIVRDTSGGLASSIKSFLKCNSHYFRERIWIGAANCSKDTWMSVTEELDQQNCKYCPLFLPQDTYESYYKGFSNSVIWPLFHCLPSYINYNDSFFDAYLEANDAFANKISSMVGKDDIIWIHDYHLLPLASMLRKKYPFLTIGFFLHIPFPTYELFRTIPKNWQEALIKGVLGADLVGFQTHDYAAQFIKCAQTVLQVDADASEQFFYDNRIIKVATFPISVDFEQFHNAYDNPEVNQLRNRFLSLKGDKKMLLSVDRLDYTKGITNRLIAYKEFLLQNREYIEKVVFKLVVVPSRCDIKEYEQKKKSIEEFVCNLNSELGTIGWQPVIYYYNHLSFETLIALYTAADAALITPIRDGMNLVSKEFISSRKDKKGVLILSEMAGAAKELKQALLVNPNDIRQMAEKIKYALEMPEEEQGGRITAMQSCIARHDVKLWAGNFLTQLCHQGDSTQESSLSGSKVPRKIGIRDSYKHAAKRLLLLDYDGTCMPISRKSLQVPPDRELVELLAALASDPRNDIYIISGRDSNRLEEWLGELPIGLIAEHGIKKRGKRHLNWQVQVPVSKGCMLNVKEILDRYTAKCPYSFIEEKEFSIAWHYRMSDPQMAAFYTKEIYDQIERFLRPSQGHILMGNMVLEVIFAGVDKGMATRNLLEQNHYDFILAAGDDTTDEYMFQALIANTNAFTIKIGSTHSFAKSTLGTPLLLRKLLRYISKNDISRFYAIKSFTSNDIGTLHET
ncbi:MAG TPA: bifunctional alpha,alpha-trehalose-phosphate synthase (UDP-forming)/trehalose-phosphatase [Edaphocola sp.]|nr:bifunctional alpha,alpha-trehalose-phosphate synthase (UDP-forming)/trehalose-phosphatase [Edaphocola sp.]